jgi:hypothetical protein
MAHRALLLHMEEISHYKGFLMKMLPLLLFGLVQIVAAFFVPIHYQPVMGIILLSLGLETLQIAL